MNREEHLYKTLPYNLLNNSTAGVEVEFIILDYNSTHNVAAEIEKRFKDLVQPNCILNVFRAEPYTAFHHNHAKNIAHKLASGDVVCNVDADNFVLSASTSYIKYIYEHYTRFCTHGSRIIPDTHGRIAMRAEDFTQLGGYDESAPLGWGFNDVDLVVRAEHEGFNIVPIPNNFLDNIKHSDEMRNENCGLCGPIWELAGSKFEYYRQRRESHGNITNLGNKWGKAERLIQYL